MATGPARAGQHGVWKQAKIRVIPVLRFIGAVERAEFLPQAPAESLESLFEVAKRGVVGDTGRQRRVEDGGAARTVPVPAAAAPGAPAAGQAAGLEEAAMCRRGLIERQAVAVDFRLWYRRRVRHRKTILNGAQPQTARRLPSGW